LERLAGRNLGSGAPARLGLKIYETITARRPLHRHLACILNRKHAGPIEETTMAITFKAASQFKTDESGSIAPMFGIMFVALILCIGVAVDSSRAIYAVRTIGSAADAAALAGGKALLDARNTDADVRALTLKYFEENAVNGKKFAKFDAPTISIDRNTRTVKVDVGGTMDTAVMKIAGINTVNIPASSTVQSDQKDIELGLALDVTGSMRGSKLSELKTAAKDLVDILIPNSAAVNKVRIGLAPYAARVNAGQFAADATNGLSTNGCVHERAGAAAFTDAKPVGLDALGFTASRNCPTAVVQALTANKASLKSNIDSYQADGATAGHIGAAWASYLISPTWNTIWPSASKPVAYGDKNTIKAMVLMTDGEFNTEYLRATNGSSADQARNICAEAKQRKVVVYTIGFQAPGFAETMLRACASSSDHFFNASNGSELREAFAEIAKQLNSLRVSQ
jgi:Flp pilus assembly protein TadG